MRTIVDIRYLPSGLVNLVFDDDTELSIDRSLINEIGLQVNQILDDKILDILLDICDGGRCYDAALNYLESRARAENEVKRHLYSKQFSPAAVNRTIERLKNSKLLDDMSFAEAWVNERIRYKPKSRLMLQKELRQKGIGQQHIDYVVEKVDEESGAYQAGLKKARLLRSENRLVFLRKLSAFLGRRGYRNEIIRSVAERLWSEISSES